MEIDTDRRIPKTFYVFRRGLHINASEDLSYHIVPQQDSFDWGVLRYALPKTVKAPSWELTVPGSFEALPCLPEG